MSQIPWEKVVSITWMDAVKFLVSAFIIVAVTKVQLFHDRLSALLIALPLTSLIAIIWMRYDRQIPDEAERVSKIANHAEGTFWFVLPTLPMFLVLPWMLRHGWGFGQALAANCVMTIGLFFLLVWVLKPFGIRLL